MGKWGKGSIPLTLRAKFTLVLLGVGVVPMLLIGIASYFSSKSTIIRQATHIQQQALQQSLTSLEEKISILETMAGSILLEDATMEMLNPSSSPDNLAQYGKEWTKFETMLNKHSFLNFTRSPMVTIFGYNGKVFSSWVSSGESLFDLLSRNQEFGRVVRAGGEAKLFWVAPHQDFSTGGSKAPQLSYVASVIDSASGKEWGKIVISMDIDTLFAPFRDLLGQFTVYGPDQELIYSSSPHPIEAIYTGDEEFSFLKGGKITSGLARDAGTGEKLLSIRGGMKNGWHIERIIPYKNILGEIASIRNFTLTFVLLATVMSILLGRVFIERILGPVRHLVYLMKQVGHGHWDDDPRIDADPELGILQKSFRQMTDNLKALQEENQHQQRVELELEFRALLSQIQPHFVKNTLAAINGLALQGDSTRILQLVDSLGYFLSTRIYQGRAIVPLEEELISLEHYLNIMRIRYPDKFEVQVHVSDALSHQSTVRFALQPIVENAIYHGMRSDSVLHIWIQAYDAGEVCTVVITDDGQGTDRDPLRERETDQELRGSLQSASGIGLVNIDQRIRLYFGTDYGLSFESVIDGGTQVEICLPRQRMEDME